MLSPEYGAVNLAVLAADIYPFAGTDITIGAGPGNGSAVISLLLFYPEGFAAGDAAVTDALSFTPVLIAHTGTVVPELCGSRSCKGKTNGG